MEPRESTRQRLESSLPKEHEDHIAGKGYNSMTHYNFGAQIYSYASSDENYGCESRKKLDTIAAWQLDKVKSKKEVVLEAQRDKKNVQFATLIGGRVVLRGDIVEEAFAVFTEQGSSASQMTAAKVMDVIARLPNCDGEEADAVPAYTQAKMEDAPRLLRIPKSECMSIFSWIRLPRPTTQMVKILVRH